jgi:cytochrome c
MKFLVQQQGQRITADKSSCAGGVQATMKRGIFASTMLLAAMNLGLAGPRNQSEQPAQPHSVWDGVYTAEQAKRGEAVYYRECSTCHGDKLAGHEEAPPLAGQDFLDSWNGLSVGKLFDKIRLTMPKGEPGTVTVQEKADILAYILSFNKFPAGKTELQKSEALKDIRFEATKPEAQAEGSNK